MKYNIKKGGNYSNSRFKFGITFKKKLTFEAMFDRSCLHGELGDSDEFDISKLFGFSTTWWHHNQSGRVGWRCIDGKTIQLLTYSYNKGKRDIKEHDVLGTVKPNEWFTCTIEDLEDKYEFTFKKAAWTQKVVTKHDAKTKDWFLFHYLLYPYFGGNKPSPHNMTITVNKK